MRRLGMKNKHRKSETASDSESEENVGARASSDNGETQTGRNNNAQKSTTKRRSSRGASVQKPATHTDDGAEAVDAVASTAVERPEERENGEKMAAGQKPSPNKRRKKEDQRASTSARDKPEDVENEYEVWRCLFYRFPPLSARYRSPVERLDRCRE